MLNFHFMILVKPALVGPGFQSLYDLRSLRSHPQAYGTFILMLAPAVCSSLEVTAVFSRCLYCGIGGFASGLLIVLTWEICVLFRLSPQGGGGSN
jgi:hypothetical protein